MKLVKFEVKVDSFHQNTYWELKDLWLNDINLIVGKNASGKSKTINFLVDFVRCLNYAGSIHFAPEYSLSISLQEGEKIFDYYYHVDNYSIILETLTVNGQNKIERNQKSSKIFSETRNTLIDIEPPQSKLIPSIRRDRVEFPFIESLIEWGENLKAVLFAIQYMEEDNSIENRSTAKSLNQAPYLLAKLERSAVQRVTEDLNKIGYQIEKIQLNRHYTPDYQMIDIKEKGIARDLVQNELSQGMYRAFTLLIYLEYLIQEKKECTLIIDDLGEGLDYERSSKLTKIILDKLKENPQIQFIATTNDMFLMDNFDIEYWNILKREGSVIKAYNYQNSKEKFDKFHFTGLNNSDLFSSNYLLATK